MSLLEPFFFRFLIPLYWFAEIFFNPISWLRRIFDNTDVNLRKGKPAMWWSVFPFTLDSQLRNIYECKLIIDKLHNHSSTSTIYVILVHQNNIKRLEMFTGINGEYSGHLRRTMTSTRILPPEHPIECIYASNSEYINNINYIIVAIDLSHVIRVCSYFSLL